MLLYANIVFNQIPGRIHSWPAKPKCLTTKNLLSFCLEKIALAIRKLATLRRISTRRNHRRIRGEIFFLF